jgi:predicted porin
MFDFGSFDASTTSAAVVGASTNVSSDMTIGGKLLYIDIENALGVDSDMSATEVDLGFSYKLGDNATYYIDFGYLMPDFDDSTITDEAALALAHKVQVFF